jgi:xanthine dehydrogenase YagS FAD-binding subunit
VAMLAYDATVHVQGVSGDRQIPLAEFYLSPGDRPDRETVLEPGDLITHVTMPPRPAGERSTYLKLRDRVSYEFALVSAAAAVSMADGVMTGVCFALGGVGTRPWRVAEAERVLLGHAPGDEVFRRAAEIALQGARPQSQNGFKVELARRCIVAALARATR